MNNWLSLFDGMSCLQIAGKELGISPDVYYASEIDKHAIAQTQLNFPDTVQLGSVTGWRDWDIDWASIRLIGAGSPCQGFSFAGKQLAFDDPRSALFFEFIAILEHCRKFNPDVKFLLENVDMERKHMRVINQYCGLFPVNINSNLVSAQNRNRWYWSNIRTKTVGLFGEIHTDIPQPADRGILLKDILETDVDEKYYLSEKMVNYFHKRSDNFNGGKVNIRERDDKSSALLASMASCDISDNFVIDTKLNPKEDQTKSSCFTAGGHSGGLHSDMDLICVSMVGRKTDENGVRKDNDKTLKAEQRLEANTTNKTNCLTGVYKDNLIMQLNPRQQRNHKDYNDKANAFLSTSHKGSQANGMTLTGTTRIRHLTPTECARLQTVPDWYIWKCSATQQYRMLGNGWTVETIKHILTFYSYDPTQTT